MKRLRRPAIIVIGFLAANLMAGAVLVSPSVVAGLMGCETIGTVGAVLGEIAGLSAVTAVFSFVPAAIVIAAAEHDGMRSLKFYVVGGAGAALLPMLFFGWLTLIGPQGSVMSLVSMLLLLVGAGGAAGFVYWAVAGRQCGPSASATIVTADGLSR